MTKQRNSSNQEVASPGYSVFVGIDISAKTADIAVLTDVKDKSNKGKVWKIKQTNSGYTSLLKRLDKFIPVRSEVFILMESTGAYWRKLAQFLDSSGYTVCVVNPLRAHYFAKSLINRDKTDAMDAMMLAKMGYSTYQLLPIWSAPPPIADKISQLLHQRDNLTHMSVQRSNRRHAFDHHIEEPLPAVIERDEELRFKISQQIRRIDKELKILIREDEAYYKTFKYLMSVDGIGVVTACWLIYVTQNFAESMFVDVRNLASLIGLVPRTFESGTSIRKQSKIGHSGQPRLRQLLYTASMSAVQNNPRMQGFYDRLVEKGKPKKSAYIAVAHKLLYVCWAVAKKQEYFDRNYHLQDAS